MNTTDLNTVLRKIESTKFKLFEIIQELETLETKVNDIAHKFKDNAEIKNISRSNFTSITKTEVDEKIEDDNTNTSKLIFDKEKSNTDMELILVP